MPGARELNRDHYLVSAVARQLEITMIQRAWIEDDVLYIQDPFDTYEVAHYPETDTQAVPTAERVTSGEPNRTNTLPHSGSNAPAPTFIGGSGHTPGAASQPAPDPEPPTNAKPAVSDEGGNCQAQRSSAALDDFTAIPGVGSVTAQKLHDAGFYTYDDLRAILDPNNTTIGINGIRSRTIAKIRTWLQERLC